MRVYVRAKTDELSGIPGNDECASLPELQAVFLNLGVDTNTYMILNPAVAPWFFTDQLSGCDVFVATDPTRLDRPIVIHSNLNSRRGNKIENLRNKGNSIDEILRSHAGYTLIARVYSAPSRQHRRGANNYLTKYKTNHAGIQLVQYDTEQPRQPFQFIGHYVGRWTFYLKGEMDGKVIILPLNP